MDNIFVRQKFEKWQQNADGWMNVFMAEYNTKILSPLHSPSILKQFKDSRGLYSIFHVSYTFFTVN